MMRGLKLFLTLGACFVIVGLMLYSGVYGQSATPDPINATSTAFVVEATQNAHLTGFSAQSVPSAGTATPLAGVCNALTFRSLDDVSAMLEAFFQRTASEMFALTSADVSAIEETANCIEFGVRETAVDLSFTVNDLDQLHDETFLGESLTEILSVIGQTVVTNLAEVRLKIGLSFGNQTRGFDVLIDAEFWTEAETIRSDEIVDWLTER